MYDSVFLDMGSSPDPVSIADVGQTLVGHIKNTLVRLKCVNVTFALTADILLYKAKAGTGIRHVLKKYFFSSPK